MKFKDLPIAKQTQFGIDVLYEFYPFTENDLEDLELNLDFHLISRNLNIEWNLSIIKKYINEWDWEALEKNTSVSNKLDLGRVFLDLIPVEKRKCNCYKELDFCKGNRYCTSRYKIKKANFKYRKSLNSSLEAHIKYLIHIKFIDTTKMSQIILYDMLINRYLDEEINEEMETFIPPEDYGEVPF